MDKKPLSKARNQSFKLALNLEFKLEFKVKFRLEFKEVENFKFKFDLRLIWLLLSKSRSKLALKCLLGIERS